MISLVGFSEPMKQLKRIKQVKIPNWQEADQSALYKRNRGIETGTTSNKSC